MKFNLISILILSLSSFNVLANGSGSGGFPTIQAKLVDTSPIIIDDNDKFKYGEVILMNNGDATIKLPNILIDASKPNPIDNSEYMRSVANNIKQVTNSTHTFKKAQIIMDRLSDRKYSHKVDIQSNNQGLTFKLRK